MAKKKMPPQKALEDGGEALLAENKTRLKNALVISSEKTQQPHLIYGVIDASGERGWAS